MSPLFRLHNSRPGRPDTFAGMPLNIEIEAGEYKSGTDEEGNEWHHLYMVPYGEILRTEGADSDPVDCYVGRYGEECKVYVVHQLKKDGSFDEDKVILGFPGAAEAEDCYRMHGPEWGFGSIEEMDLQAFKDGYLASNRPEGHLQNALVTVVEPSAPVIEQRFYDEPITEGGCPSCHHPVVDHNERGCCIPECCCVTDLAELQRLVACGLCQSKTKENSTMKNLCNSCGAAAVRELGRVAGFVHSQCDNCGDHKHQPVSELQNSAPVQNDIPVCDDCRHPMTEHGEFGCDVCTCAVLNAAGPEHLAKDGEELDKIESIVKEMKKDDAKENADGGDAAQLCKACQHPTSDHNYNGSNYGCSECDKSSGPCAHPKPGEKENGFTTNEKMVMKANARCPRYGDSGRLFVSEKTGLCDSCMNKEYNRKNSADSPLYSKMEKLESEIKLATSQGKPTGDLQSQYDALKKEYSDLVSKRDGLGNADREPGQSDIEASQRGNRMVSMSIPELKELIALMIGKQEFAAKATRIGAEQTLAAKRRMGAAENRNAVRLHKGCGGELIVDAAHSGPWGNFYTCQKCGADGLGTFQIELKNESIDCIHCGETAGGKCKECGMPLCAKCGPKGTCRSCDGRADYPENSNASDAVARKIWEGASTSERTEWMSSIGMPGGHIGAWEAQDPGEKAALVKLFTEMGNASSESDMPGNWAALSEPTRRMILSKSGFQEEANRTWEQLSDEAKAVARKVWKMNARPAQCIYCGRRLERFPETGDRLLCVDCDLPEETEERSRPGSPKYKSVNSNAAPKIPSNFEVQPLKPGEVAKDKATCGTCGLSWDDGKITGMTPAPSGRCPFEAFHEYDNISTPASREAAGAAGYGERKNDNGEKCKCGHYSGGHRNQTGDCGSCQCGGFEKWNDSEVICCKCGDQERIGVADKQPGGTGFICEACQ